MKTANESEPQTVNLTKLSFFDFDFTMFSQTLY